MPAARVVARFKAAMSNTDWVVRDPELLPTKLAKRYARALLKIGVGTRIEVIRSVADIPRDGDYRIYTVLEITPRHGERSRAAITLNVSEDQRASGSVRLDALRRNLSVPSGTPDQVIDRMMAEVVGLLRR